MTDQEFKQWQRDLRKQNSEEIGIKEQLRDLRNPKPIKGKRKYHPRKLKPYHLEEIRNDMSKGRTATFIAAKFGISLALVYKIKSGELWSQV